MDNWQQTENTKINTVTKGTKEYMQQDPYELLERAIKALEERIEREVKNIDGMENKLVSIEKHIVEKLEERIKKLEEKQDYDLK